LGTGVGMGAREVPKKREPLLFGMKHYVQGCWTPSHATCVPTNRASPW